MDRRAKRCEKSNPKVKVQFENEKNAVYQLQHRAKGVQDY